VTSSPSAAAESLLAFWAEGGVDAMLLDAPVDRIAAGRVAPPRPPARAHAPPPAAPGAPAAPDVSPMVDEARALAAAAGDLDALAAAIAAFDGCPLKSAGAATQPVFFRGDPAAPVVVVGEGPGAEEDRQGKPFVGRAGQLLDRMLAAAGLSERVFITNTVFWRPPGNRDPEPLEQAVCRPFLERAIALVRPKMLLLVGAPSARSMLKTDQGILSLRGRWQEWRSARGDRTSRPADAAPGLPPAPARRQEARLGRPDHPGRAPRPPGTPGLAG
jgi:DNA polymerase